MFSVYLNGGVKSLLGKAERVENVKSVMLINYVLFNLNFKFSRKFTDRVTWHGTGIKLTDRSFNPILDWQEVSTRKSMGDELSQPTNQPLILDEIIFPFLSAMDSHGNVVVGDLRRDDIKVISRTGASKVVKLPDSGEGKVIEQGIAGLTVDKNNNVYIVRWLDTRTENSDAKSLLLDVLDENYNVKHDCIFDFHQDTRPGDVVWMAINKNSNIIMSKPDDPHIYVCDNVGQLKHKFERHSIGVLRFGISNKDKIMVPSGDRTAVLFYSEEGNLKSTIKLPEGHTVCGMAFYNAICKIIVLTYVQGKDSYFLVCYTETGELETSTLFSKRNYHECFPSITSHPSGPVTVVMEKIITFI